MKPTAKEQSNITPREDLMNDALRHYEIAGMAIHEHRSDIPRAIRAYYAPLPLSGGAEEILDEEIKEYAKEYDILFRVDDDPDTHEMRFVVSEKFVKSVHDMVNSHAWRIIEERLKDMYPKAFLEWLKGSECRYWFNSIIHKWGLYDKFVEFEEVYRYWKEKANAEQNL